MTPAVLQTLGRLERELLLAQGDLQNLKTCATDGDLKDFLFMAMKHVKAARDRIEEATDRARDLA